MRALLWKETTDLLRERRLLGFVLVAALVLFLVGRGAARKAVFVEEAGLENVESYWTLLGSFQFAILFLVFLAALLFAADAFAKEQEWGTMRLLKASPTSRPSLFFAKLLPSLVPYALTAALALLAAIPSSQVVGFVLVRALAILLAGPYLLLYLSLVGLCLFVSSVSGSGRRAIATSLLAMLPLYLFYGQNPLRLILQQSPFLERVILSTPFDGAHQFMESLLGRGAVPWTALAVTALLAAASLTGAYRVIATKEETS